MKGQEFDVFRLLISAAIAITIFLILMNLLHGFSFFGNKLDDAIKNTINQCGFNCECVTSKAVVSGSQGTEISMEPIADETGVVSITVNPSSDLSDIISGSGTSIALERTINNMPIWIAVHCDNGDCTVGLGTNVEDAKSEAGC
jgi:hypothetical protein